MAKRRRKRKSRKAWWLIIPLLILAAASIIYVWYTFFRIKKARFARYPAFGIDLPVSYEIHGIDVSKYQSYIYWPAVKSMKVNDVKIGFTFIKATEGVLHVDKQFRRNWALASKARITKGAYHFFNARRSGRAQARNFIKTVKLSPGDLPPVLDVEQLHGVKPEKMRKEVKDFLLAIEQHYGVKPILYTYVSFYSDFMGREFNRYPLWVAHYHERNRPRIRRPWIFWQHSERGRVNGIASYVDFNVFNGDSTDFADLLIK